MKETGGKVAVSYEGYIQHVCENGHYHARDSYDDPKRCPDCDAPWALSNNVDCTNDSGWKQRVEIESVLERVEQRGYDRALRDVVAWLRKDVKHAALVSLLETGEWTTLDP